MSLLILWIVSFFVHLVLSFGVSMGLWYVLVVRSEERQLNVQYWVQFGLWFCNSVFLFCVPVFIWS